MMNFQMLRDFDRKIAIEYSEKLSVNDSSVRKNVSSTMPPDSLPNSLKEFYSQAIIFKYHWETIEPLAKGKKIAGNINIEPADQVVKDWKGIVYFDEDDNEELRNFKIVDFFVDEACVGYIQDKSNSDEMYYLYLGEDEPQSLGVSFEGYLELLLAAKGFWYWQLALLHLKNGDKSAPEVKQFKTYMPQIFPDFKWEEFVGLYERVRIK